MDTTMLYRPTPYEFALTAEPRQMTVICGRMVSGTVTSPLSPDTGAEQESEIDSRGLKLPVPIFS
jgi:hypothetical protein